MSETPEVAAPVAEAPAVAAPAAAAPAAPAAEVDASASSSEAPVASESAVTHESFDWDGWEGSSETFPEDIRPWADKISSHYTQYNESLKKNHHNLKELYDSILTGSEDPRIKEFEESRTSWDAEKADFLAKQEELQNGWDTTKQNYEAYEQAVYKYHVDKAEKQLEVFVGARPEILKDEAKYKLFSELLDERWDLDSADKILKMSPEAATIARKAKSEGVPASYAIKFAEKAPPQVQNPQPRPAATITSGAVSRTTPHASSRGMGDAKSLEESRAMASARALKLHKR